MKGQAQRKNNSKLKLVAGDDICTECLEGVEGVECLLYTAKDCESKIIREQFWK